MLPASFPENSSRSIVAKMSAASAKMFVKTKLSNVKTAISNNFVTGSMRSCHGLVRSSCIISGFSIVSVLKVTNHFPWNLLVDEAGNVSYDNLI